MIVVNTREFATSIIGGSNLDYSTYASSEFKANAGERVLAHYEFTLTVTSQITTGEEFDFTTALQCTRLLGDFIADGFAVGDTFKYYNSGGSYVFTGSVTNVTNNVLQYSVSSGTAPTTVVTAVNSKFRYNGTPAALFFKFGLPYNSEGESFVQRLTGIEQAYICTLASVGTYAHALPTDPNFETGSLRMRATTPTDEFTTHYELEHIFVMPGFADEYEGNLLLNSTPSGFIGSNACRYIPYIEFRANTGQNNNNKTFTDNLLGGGARWYNQNVNYLPVVYSLASISYVSDTTVTGIEPKKSTHVTATFSCSSAIISANTLLFISHQIAKSPTFTSVSQGTNERIAYDYFGGDLGDTGDGPNSIIKNVASTVLSTTSFTVEFDIEDIDTSLIVPTDYFLLSFGFGEEAQNYTVTDKTTLYAYGQYVINSDVDGLVDFTSMRLYDYAQPYATNSATPGVNDSVKVWDQDEMQLEFDFNINLAGTTADPTLTSISFELIAFNTVTGESFIFPNSVYSFPLTIVPKLEGGLYLVDYASCTDRRLYNELINSDFKRCSIVTSYNSFLDPTIASYSGFVGFKVDWQTWLQNANVDTVFYDANQPFNNLNNKVSNYSELSDYRIHAAIKVGVTTFDALTNAYTLTEYRERTVPIIVCDWDDDRNTPDHWIQDVYTFSEDGTIDYGGAILSSGKTLMKVIWTRYAATSMLAADMIAAHRIEPANYPTASFLERFGNNGENVGLIFSPVTGETDLKITKISTTVVHTECLIDGSKLQKGYEYNLSARLWAD